MSNINIANYDISGIVIGNPNYDDYTVKFGGAAILAPGTMMARDTTDDTIVPYAVGGLNGTDIPSLLLTIELEAVGAGNLPCRLLKSGEVRANKVFADATPSTALTVVEKETLRSFDIIANDVRELNKLDNQ